MRQLFILGDSISIHYGPYLEQMVKKHFIYARKEGLNEALKNLDYPTGANGGDSSMVRAYLQERFAEKDFQAAFIAGHLWQLFIPNPIQQNSPGA